MNEIRLMKAAFNFLEKDGYAVSTTKNNIEYGVTYSKFDKQIALSYDLRQHRFDVGIRDIKGSNDYLPLLEMNIGNKTQKKELIDMLNTLYHEIDTDWTISKKHFCEIVNAYAEFVKRNISAVMTC